MRREQLSVMRGPWTIVWRGGRLADVFHAEVPGALACVQVGDYDYHFGRLEVLPTMDDLRDTLDEWIKSDGPSYLAELPYLR